jgi:hypothetical protein
MAGHERVGEIMDLIIGIGVGMVVMHLWHIYSIWRILKRIESQTGIDIERMVEQVQQDVTAESEATDKKHLICEYASGQLLIYDRDNFVTQGRTLDEVRQNLKLKYGEEREYALNIKGLDSEAKARLLKEIQQNQ